LKTSDETASTVSLTELIGQGRALCHSFDLLQALL